MSRNILICSAWPYANGSLHLGHIAGLLPADILARYFRRRRDKVLFVSGSDCHGTPIAVRAAQEERNPGDLARQYHDEFVEHFKQLGFSYDRYAATIDDGHKELVGSIIAELNAKKWLYQKTVLQTWCDTCVKFLPDRYVEGTCPRCGDKGARGDQCDACGALLDPEDLGEGRCKLCGQPPGQRETDHLYFKLSEMQQPIEDLLEAEGLNWRLNAREMTRRYLREGLHDRAITRDIDWGIDVPVEGFGGKKIYVWFEAVLGYFTTSQRWASEHGDENRWRDFWSKGATSYYVHGKDNIPFHTVIFPGLLLAMNPDYNLPNRIISSEYLTIEGKKLSTSRNWAVWVPDYLENYSPDALRYFLTVNGPESRDADFSWREFVERNNGELAGAWGNLVNRTVSFLHKYYDGKVPGGSNPEGEDLLSKIEALYTTTGNAIEDGRFKEALKDVFELVRACNKYFDSQAPWQTIKNDPAQCGATITTCLEAIANLAILTEPFLPFAGLQLFEAFGLDNPYWERVRLSRDTLIQKTGILFPSLDKEIIEVERGRLMGSYNCPSEVRG